MDKVPEHFKANQHSAQFVITCCLTILLGLFAIPGCFYAMDNQEVEGSYIAEYEFGTDRLEIKPDGTYTQEIKLKADRTVLRGGGRWKYDEITHRVDRALREHGRSSDSIPHPT